MFFNNPFSGTLGENDEVLTPEEEKRQRIDWHRRNVRNGPIKMSSLSEGRIVSRERRAKRAMLDKMNRKHRRTWLGNRVELAILRAKLQEVGVIEYVTGFVPATSARIRAGEWIVQRFGERDDEGRIVLSDSLLPDAVAKARDYYRSKGAA